MRSRLRNRGEGITVRDRPKQVRDSCSGSTALKCRAGTDLEAGFRCRVRTAGRISRCPSKRSAMRTLLVRPDKHAKNIEFLMSGVATPARKPGNVLSRSLRMKYDFHSELNASENLEIGLAALVARFGFRAHLIDSSEAVDEMVAIVVTSGEYDIVDLGDWTAITW